MKKITSARMAERVTSPPHDAPTVETLTFDASVPATSARA